MEVRSRHRVLVIAYYFPPLGLSGVQRTLKFVKYLPEFGWDVTVLTVEDRGYFAKDEELLQELEGLPVDIIRTPSLDPLHFFRRKNVVRMPSARTLGLLSKLSQTVFLPDNKIGWKKQAVSAALAYLETHPVDVIFATAPPYTAFLIGRELKRRTGLPLIVDYRDSWIDNPLHFYLTPLHKALHYRLERRVLRETRHIISINRPIKERILQAHPFLSHNDISIISQGFDQKDFEGLARSGKNNDRMRIVYAGTFYYNRNPNAMFAALRALADTDATAARGIELHLIGTPREGDQALVRKYGLERSVIFHGYLSHRETLRHLVDADVLWLLIGRGKGEEMMSTGKLYEYLGARKPILACVPPGAAQQVLEKGKTAFIVDPDDTDAISAQLRTLFALFKSDRLPALPYDYASQFERKALTGQLASVLASALESGPPAARVRAATSGRGNNSTGHKSISKE
ncbi:MAG: glycosyltransferase family 4 protein [Bacteroidetes bacterium]|nr:glycosyltransferase family 4 protein [Bacteroidota bacterium]